MPSRPILAIAVLTFFATVLVHRWNRNPGNLTPVQLISALGAWALIFANASALAIAIRDGSMILLCTVVATIAVAVTTFLREDVTRISDYSTPEPLQRFVGDIQQLLGRASRLGMSALEAVVVTGRCPAIGVSVAQQGRVAVRIRRDVVQWLERHQQPGGAGAAVIGSFVRFAVLHELGHVLNGDHRTFRFVRSVLIAHFVWVASGLFMTASLMTRHVAKTPLFVAASIVLMWVAQSLVARRFIAERERLADWRAMQTLAPADAARLLERRGRHRSTRNPTELEKLMTDLKTQTPPGVAGGLLSRLIALVWHEGDDTHRRAELAAGDRAPGMPQPVRWAALVGMQCAFLSMSLSLAVRFTVAPWLALRSEGSQSLMMTILWWCAGLCATFCAMRVDPARVSVNATKRRGLRPAVGVIFLLTFFVTAFVLYAFQIVIRAEPQPLYFAVMLTVTSFVAGMCVWMAGVIGGSDGGGEILDTPRSRWVHVYPVLAGFVVLLVPVSVGVSHWLAIGTIRSYHWVALMLMSVGMLTVSTAMSRSTNGILRGAAPMALLDTPSPVYGFRVFWWNFYVDLSRMTLVRATVIATVAQTVMMVFFVFGAGLLMQRAGTVLSAQWTLPLFFYGAFGVFLLVVIIPDRSDAYRDPRIRQLDRNRLQLFETLLAASRTADREASSWLSASLSQWMRHDRLVNEILPDRWIVWPLAPLLSLVRLARETGQAALIGSWRDRIARSLREIIVDDAVVIAPGQPPSLYWTALAASILDEADLRHEFPFGRMLDRIEALLEERLTQGTDNLLSDVVTAARLLRKHGRPGPDLRTIRRFASSSSIVSRPLLRQSLLELCELADLSCDAEMRARLGPIVRSRMWEALQLNPRKDVLLLLDCYLAAQWLDETDSRHAAAALVIGELTDRVSKELLAIANG